MRYINIRLLLLLPWVRPWDNRGNVTWMERGFNAGQLHRSMYASIFDRLRAIARYWSAGLASFCQLVEKTGIFRG